MVDTVTDIDVIEAMSTYGGSFVQALARAWRAADAGNRETLKKAFPELWAHYRNQLEAKARRRT